MSMAHDGRSVGGEEVRPVEGVKEGKEDVVDDVVEEGRRRGRSRRAGAGSGPQGPPRRGELGVRPGAASISRRATARSTMLAAIFGQLLLVRAGLAEDPAELGVAAGAPGPARTSGRRPCRPCRSGCAARRPCRSARRSRWSGTRRRHRAPRSRRTASTTSSALPGPAPVDRGLGGPGPGGDGIHAHPVVAHLGHQLDGRVEDGLVPALVRGRPIRAGRPTARWCWLAGS